jgi:dipeptidyl aminopeptidase/acylaminoacyl peptidase
VGTIHETTPQEILERHEQVTLMPLLIMQGGLDDNVLPETQETLAATYRASGGRCEYHVFEGCTHQ